MFTTIIFYLKREGLLRDDRRSIVQEDTVRESTFAKQPRGENHALVG